MLEGVSLSIASISHRLQMTWFWPWKRGNSRYPPPLPPAGKPQIPARRCPRAGYHCRKHNRRIPPGYCKPQNDDGSYRTDDDHSIIIYSDDEVEIYLDGDYMGVTDAIKSILVINKQHCTGWLYLKCYTANRVGNTDIFRKVKYCGDLSWRRLYGCHRGRKGGIWEIFRDIWTWAGARGGNKVVLEGFGNSFFRVSQSPVQIKK